ncbi:MAG: hypothetical protein ACRD3J_28000, partial [Thermoanaerobaculia bacterium]
MLKSAKSEAEEKLAKLQKQWAAGGSANTRAQQQALARTGKQNVGRPARVCTLCGERVRGGHIDPSFDQACGSHAWEWEKPEVARKRLARAERVSFESQSSEVEVGAMSEKDVRRRAAAKASATKGPSEHKRAADMAAWTRKHGKSVPNPYAT